MKWWGCVALSILVLGCCTAAFAAPFQVKSVSPVTSAVPTAVQPMMKTAVPVVAVTRVTAVNPRVLKLQAGDPAEQVSLAGSALDKATSAQLLQNNRPAAGINVQLLGGSPGMRPVRINATSSAVAGNYTLRLVAGVTRVDVPLTTFSVQVTKAAQAPMIKQAVGGVVGMAQPTVALPSAKAMPGQPAVTPPVAVASTKSANVPGLGKLKPAAAGGTMALKPVTPKTPVVRTGNLPNAAGSALNPMLMNKSLIKVTRPAAGYVSCKGKTQPIQWNRDTSDLSPVKITLRAYNQEVMVIANNATDIGQYDWLVPDDPSIGTPYYTIRVEKVTDSTKFGDSGQFNISECDVTQAGMLPQTGQATLGGGSVAIPTAGEISTPEFDQQSFLTLGNVKFLDSPRKGMATYIVDSIAYASHGLTTKSPDSLKIGEPTTIEAECPTGGFLRKLELLTLGGSVASEQWTGVAQKTQKKFFELELASDTAIKAFYCTETDMLQSFDIDINLAAELTCLGKDETLVKIEANMPYPVLLTCDTRMPFPAKQTAVEWEHTCPDGYELRTFNGLYPKTTSSVRDASDPMICNPK